MKLKLSRPLFAVICAVLLAIAMVGCTDDESRPPTSPSGGGDPVPGGSSGNGGTTDGDAGDDAGDDVGDDADHDAGHDAGDDTDASIYCELEPSDLAADPTRPCCFDDRDCRESGLPQAEQMYCYHADCDAGVQGVCRVPPLFSDECWDRWDCAEDQACLYELDPENLDCELYTRETPDVCVDD